MPPDSPGDEASVLQYASSRPAALKPNEIILWQAASTPQLAEPHPAEIKLSQQPRDVFYFVTNQRIIATEEGAKFVLADRPNLPPATRIVVKTAGPKVASVFVNHFAMKDLEDWRGLCKTIASLPRKTSRNFVQRGHWSRRRDGPVKSQTHAPPSNTMNSEQIENTHELPLLDGEKLIWTGRPLKWPQLTLSSFGRAFWILLWMLAPICVATVRFLDAQADKAVNVVIFIVAGIWIAFSLWALLAKPFTDASKRNRTRYFLSNIRGFVVEPQGRSRKIDMVFLDGLGPKSTLTENLDGTGDVTIAHHLTFRGIKDARHVHILVMETIQSAAGTFEGITGPQIV